MRQAAALAILIELAACAQQDAAEPPASPDLESSVGYDIAPRSIPDSVSPAPYRIVIRDDEAYWDTTMHGGSARFKRLALPDSNLTACDGTMPSALAAALDAEVAAEFARLNEFNESHPYTDGSREATFTIVERPCYRVGDVSLGLVRARTTRLEWEALVIGVLRPNESPRVFAESNTLDEPGRLIAYAAEGEVPVVYGFRNGNPNLNYGGHFRLAFEPTERVLSFEYYEQTR